MNVVGYRARWYVASLVLLNCHETTAHDGTLLESIVLGVELCIVRRFQQDSVEPACDVLVVLSRLLLVVFLCPKTGTGILGKKSSGEEL